VAGSGGVDVVGWPVVAASLSLVVRARAWVGEWAAARR